jgi:predicted Zn-dependent protease
VRASTALLVFLLVSLSQGCSAAATSLESWIQREGGICSDTRQDRVELVSRPLLARLREPHVTVQVLDSDCVCAYGWPNGRLFVTRGLVDLLDDHELAAAIAHEMGHLLNDGHVRHADHLQTAVSLRGCAEQSEALDAESEADAIAADLLAVEGMSPTAVLRMLEKVSAAGSASPACRAALGQRISLLSKRPRSATTPAATPLPSR